MSDDQKKTLFIGLAAAGVALSAAVIYYNWSKPGSPEDELKKELEEANLTTVKRGSKGKLDNQYFLSLLQFVGAKTRERTKGLRSECLEQRRQHFRANEWSNYRKVIKEVMEGEDQTAQAVVKQILPLLNITTDEFAITHDEMAKNPSTAEFVMAAQQGKLTQSTENQPQPQISKQKTLDVFEQQQKKSITHMKSLTTRSRAEQERIDNMDANEQMLNMMVDQSKMHDEMYYLTGVENEVFEEALMWYVLKKDPEIQKKMGEYMQKMQAEMTAPRQQEAN